jgi:phosphonate transport system ATP-binding protein
MSEDPTVLHAQRQPDHPVSVKPEPDAGLVLHGLTRRFGHHVAVDGVTAAIDKGSFVGVIGRSGAGKSTLLRMINRLVDPSSGRILWAGQDVTALRGAALRRWRARSAMVFQQFNLVGRLDVLTNVILGRLNALPAARSLLGWWTDEDKLAALAALELFDMAGFAAQRADSLSGGQPEIVLADEPVASLDPRNTRIVMDALARLNREFGITVLCNLHAVDLARSYCDRLIGLADGRVVFDGSPAELSPDAVSRLYGLDASHDPSSHPDEEMP